MNARLIVVEDDATLRISVQRYLARLGHEVRAAPDGETGVRMGLEQPADVVLVDLNLPGINGLGVIARLRDAGSDAIPVVMTAYPDVRTAVAALKAGAYDYINKPFDLNDLAGLVDRAVEVRRLRQEVAWRRVQARAEQDEPLVGESVAVRALISQLDHVAAAADTPVLITGESGTGKEHLARALHRRSARREGPWITLDCASSRSEDFDELLFGRELATGAGRRGLLELAEGGTLFLDEVGELAPGLQPRLLRVIETGMFRRVGSVFDQGAAVRFVAATHRDLGLEVQAGRFRADLRYRLDVTRLHVPALRERPHDVAPLFVHFLQAYARRLRRALPAVSPVLLETLRAYPWPGNVRELRNLVERLLILSDGATLEPGALPVEYRLAPPTRQAADDDELSLHELELRHIRRVLERCKGNKTRAAELLGISRLTLRQRLKDAGTVDEER
ncbi:MAG: sigma-54 dependent transcriptional regulator [Aquabacterium commune]|uniref:sigma-54-dependent transcriptional regulator n=1 Tax=Aquabacterium commune TaxID=70586 RepID=UPI003BB16C49